MEINYYVSDNDFKNVVQTITRKQKYYSEGIIQLFALAYWFSSFMLDKNENQHLWTSITITTFAWLITALFTRYLFHTVHPKLIVKRNKNAIKYVSLVLQGESIQLISNNNSKFYNRKKVLKVKELETTYAIVFPRNFFIVIPKTSGLTEIDEQDYSDRLTEIIEEIKRSSRYKSK